MLVIKLRNNPRTIIYFKKKQISFVCLNYSWMDLKILKFANLIINLSFVACRILISYANSC